MIGKAMLALALLSTGCGGTYVSAEAVAHFRMRHDFDSEVQGKLSKQQCEDMMRSRLREDAAWLCALGEEDLCQH